MKYQPKTFGWIHVAVMGHWRDVLAEQFDLIEAAGLAQETGRIRAVVAGDEDPDTTAWFPSWADVVHRQADLKLGETPTLLRLWEWARHQGQGKLWYVHTKGVSHDPDNLLVKDWRDLLNYYTITRWRECSAALDRGFDMAGANFYKAGDPDFARVWGFASGTDLFAGNFWWSTVDHIAKLPPSGVSLGDNRWQAEYSFATAGDPKVFCVHNSNVNHYHKRYPNIIYGKLYDVTSGCASPWRCRPVLHSG